MLLFNSQAIGNRLLSLRKRSGLTQAELAEAAGLSERTYADIERGTVNMRTQTLMRICQAMDVTPNDILTDAAVAMRLDNDGLNLRLAACSPTQKATAYRLLDVYLSSLEDSEPSKNER